MTRKVIARRAVARRDIEQSADHYFREGGVALELRFLAAVETAIDHIARHPASGSLRYADLASLPDLRFWPVQHFPFLIFYIEHEDRVDVWRVLHSERDLPASLRFED